MSLAPGMLLRVLSARVSRRVRSALPGSRTTYVTERVAEYRGYWSEAATILGASFEEVNRGVWEVRREGRATQLASYITQCDDPVILQLAGDKPFGYRLAMAAGVPVPEHRVVTLATIDEAEGLLTGASSAPLVVKPAAGSSSGLGVSTGVRSRSELESAAVLASLYDDRILVERMVPGESYRLLYLAGRAIHAVRRRGLRVTGDGNQSVSRLLAGGGHAAVERDPMIEPTLAAQGSSLADIPRAGREILVRGLPPHADATRELRTVYDESVLDQCSADLIEEGAAVVRGLGSELAGVDLITTDPSRPLRSSGGAFIEVNTTPGIHHHYIGAPRRGDSPVAVQVLDYLLTRNGVCPKH